MSLTAAPRPFTRRTRLSAAAIALPLALAVTLTGCSAGQQAQTAAKRPGVEGASAQLDDLRVLNVHFVAPGDAGKYEAGDEVELEMVVTTLGAGDEITKVSVDGEDATITPTSASGSSSAPASGSASPSAATGVQIPADGKVFISADGGDATIQATMSDEVYSSALIPVVITFADAGELELEVPVATSSEEIERDEDQMYVPKEGEH